MILLFSRTDMSSTSCVTLSAVATGWVAKRQERAAARLLQRMKKGIPPHEQFSMKGSPSPETAALATWSARVNAEVLGVRMKGPFFAEVTLRVEPGYRIRSTCVLVNHLWYVAF